MTWLPVSDELGEQVGVVALRAITGLFPLVGPGGTWTLAALGVDSPAGSRVYAATGLSSKAEALEHISALLPAATPPPAAD